MKSNILLAALAVSLLPSAAMADRGPNQMEAQAIAKSLTDAGFKSWNKVEYDPDGPVWKVDDARMLDGKTFDVKLSAGDYRVLKADGD